MGMEPGLRTGHQLFDRRFMVHSDNAPAALLLLDQTVRGAIVDYAQAYPELLLTPAAVAYVHRELHIPDTQMGRLLNAQADLVGSLQRRLAAITLELDQL
ncbi:MAG: hypothetical protein AAFX99_21105, partial [Myxococcota bacterium]